MRQEGDWLTATRRQPSRLVEFLDALEPGDRPLAAVIHLVLPHAPWRYLPDGRDAAMPADAAGLDGAFRDDWVRAVERQRHLLQASYADSLVGEILRRLEEIGVYDDAAIAVTADHGIAFSAGPERRLPEDGALPEIMWTPLIVKSPNQTEGVVDDSNIESADVLPTLAAAAGMEIPWPVDGFAAGSAGIVERGDTKLFRRFKSPADFYPSKDVEVDARSGLDAVLGMAFPSLAGGDDPIAGIYAIGSDDDLVDRPYVPSERVAADTLAVDDVDRLLEAGRVVVVLTGSVRASPRPVDRVVADVGGTIVGASPLVQRDDGAGFVIVLPVDDPVDLGTLRLGVVSGSSIADAGSVVG
jgi:hypothetical protein